MKDEFEKKQAEGVRKRILLSVSELLLQRGLIDGLEANAMKNIIEYGEMKVK